MTIGSRQKGGLMHSKAEMTSVDYPDQYGGLYSIAEVLDSD